MRSLRRSLRVLFLSSLHRLETHMQMSSVCAEEARGKSGGCYGRNEKEKRKISRSLPTVGRCESITGHRESITGHRESITGSCTSITWFCKSVAVYCMTIVGQCPLRHCRYYMTRHCRYITGLKVYTYHRVLLDHRGAPLGRLYRNRTR